MFDPERDEEPDSSRFYMRLLAVVVISAAGCLALWPSVSGFSSGIDGEKGCLAVVNGWHADRPGLTQAEQDLQNTRFVGLEPSPEQLRLLEHAEQYLDWRNGGGACIPESRHRLILSGIGLASLAAMVGGLALVVRTRTSLRRPPAVIAGA